MIPFNYKYCAKIPFLDSTSIQDAGKLQKSTRTEDRHDRTAIDLLHKFKHHGPVTKK